MKSFSDMLQIIENIVDPETGEQFNQNPFIGDDGSYKDAAKAQGWEARKRQAMRKMQSAKDAKQQDFKNNFVKDDRGLMVNKMDAAWDAFSKLFQKYFDAFVANKIADPYKQHPGFRKLSHDTFQKFQLNPENIKEIEGWYYNGKPSAFGVANNLKYLQHAIQKKTA